MALAALLSIACGASPPRRTGDTDQPSEWDAASPIPPIDRDHDGIADDDDRCPCDAEDPDGWQDVDGCPDPDNDGDQIPDVCDVCLNEPETYNGRCDADGCPDRGLVVLRASRIEILQFVVFARNRSTPSPSSNALLEELAQTLIGNPQITLVAIVGEAEPGERHPEQLAHARAEAVLEEMAQRGVASDRLVAEADVSSAPTGAPAGAHRRVRFEVRLVDGAPQPQWAPTMPSTETSPPDDCEVPVCNPPPTPPAC